MIWTFRHLSFLYEGGGGGFTRYTLRTGRDLSVLSRKRRFREGGGTRFEPE